VGKVNEFTGATNAALQFIEANPNYVVVFGILPTEPNTGLGYIKKREEITEIDGYTVSKVASFHEKPNLATAKKFIRNGQYLWNGGYFLFSAQGMIKHFRELSPEITKRVEQYLNNPQPDLYSQVPSEQIDTAIAEKLSSNNLAVIPVDLDWSDIGSWATLHEILTKNGQSNATPSGIHVSDDDGSGTLVLGGSKLIVTVGLQDAVVIDTDDVILICDKKSSQDVKKIVEKLKKEGKEHLL
jgi:mannose-1-phosphate guanylyltransferase